MIGLRELERNLEANRTLYQTFLSRAREATEQVIWSRATRASFPAPRRRHNRSWPPRGVLLGLACLEDWASARAWRWRATISTSGLHTSATSRITLAFPVIGVVPRFLPIPWTLPQEVECRFLRLRDTIRYTAAGRPNRVVMITSAAAGDGKSTIASTLAAAAASEGERVLLFDGPFCSRSISRRSELDLDIGRA